HDSGLIPSVLGEGGLSIVTPSTVTLSQYCGLTVQNGEFCILISLICTLLQRINWINGGRKKPRSTHPGKSGASTSLLRRLNSFCHFVSSPSFWFRMVTSE